MTRSICCIQQRDIQFEYESMEFVPGPCAEENMEYIEERGLAITDSLHRDLPDFGSDRWKERNQGDIILRSGIGD